MRILKVLAILALAIGGYVVLLSRAGSVDATVTSPSGRHRVVIRSLPEVLFLGSRLRIDAFEEGWPRTIVDRTDEWSYSRTFQSWSQDEQAAAVLVCGAISAPELITLNGSRWTTGGENSEVRRLRERAWKRFGSREPGRCAQGQPDRLFWLCCLRPGSE